MTERKPIQSCR